ncbi:MAG: carboxypeptidase-like regulatory domain-containing protein [Planctomycetota bacterium]
MKRSGLVFVTVVFTALLTGILLERGEEEEPFQAIEFTPRRIHLEPLEIPRGEHALAGRILDATGAPAADVRVHLWPAEAPASGTAEPPHGAATDGDGRFRLEGLFSGTYRVALLQVGHPNALREVAVPAPEGEVEWRLADPLPPFPVLPEIRRRDLAGTLSPPVGSPPDAPPAAGYEVVLRPAAPTPPLSGATERRVRTGEAGAFAVPDLVAAAYLVQVLPPWAAGGSWPVLDEVELAHAAEGPAAPLSLRLRTGELSGRIGDPEGRAVAGALARVWPEGLANRLWPPQETAADGSFLFRDLPPGSYRLRIRAGSGALEQSVLVRIGARTEVALPPLDPAAGG